MIVLDTHAWVWWAADAARLSGAAKKAIEADPRRAISAISLWEVATLVSKGRLLLDRDPREWLEAASTLDGLEVIPLRPAIAVRSTQLGRAFHDDPADRLIVATAMAEGARLVTKDARIRAYAGVTSIW
jgi:PIN domain nuclease of toxin-antitoxin system